MLTPLVALSTAFTGPDEANNWDSEYWTESQSNCLNGPCGPGNEFCGKPFEDAPTYHLMDQHGCGENDPNGPVFDPVHGVFHHFYQIHLAAILRVAVDLSNDLQEGCR